MLVSIALILISGMLLGNICKRLHLPPLIGMMAAGIILGPCVLNVLSGDLLGISADIRRIALVIILTRAGLNLDINQLKKAGLPAILMCFVPATFEIAAVTIFAPMLFPISHTEAALCGAVLAAVSPAVTVPRMIRLIDEGYGVKKQIPRIILAGASADDVYVIVLFTSFLSMAGGGELNPVDLIQIPTSVILGAVTGAVAGILLVMLFKAVNISDNVKTVILLSISFLLLGLEDISQGYIKISGLIAIMAMGMAIFAKAKPVAEEIGKKYSAMWIVGEIMLFALVGAAADLNALAAGGVSTLILLGIALAVRMVGVFVSLLFAKMNFKERLFCCLAYTPKATVQAAIGGTALSLGLPCGNLVLSIAVTAILVTAPLGALAIDLTYKKLLDK